MSSQPPNSGGGSSGPGGGSSGSNWQAYRAVKIDVHQTMVEATHSPELGKPQPGVIRYIKNVMARGYFVWLSCGGFSHGTAREKANYRDKVTQWLKNHGIDTRMVGFLADPQYVIDISDRAVAYQGNWDEMWDITVGRINRLERTHSPDGPITPLKVQEKP